MSGMRCRRWILKSYFEGMPRREDLNLVEEELPNLQDGEFLLEAVWLSVDPYMRPYSRKLPLGQPMIGEQVAKVIQTKNKQFAVGDFVLASCGWVSHFICNDDTVLPFGPVTKLYLPPDMLSQALGILGVTGITAYFGLLEILQPKEGETLVVNAGAGAVGSVVGQIAKIKGCRVVGFAGSDAKVKYMKSLGFDAAYNYKTITSLRDALNEACPNGIDVFFDNVGGEFFATVIGNMNLFGRVALCGAISEYNMPDNKLLVNSVAQSIVFNQIKVEGFIVSRWLDKFTTAIMELKGWLDEGNLKSDEHVTEGFENMFDAFHGLFNGKNIGKSLVKV